MMKHSQLNINRFSIGIFVLTAVIMLFFGVEVRRAGHGVKEQIKVNESRRECEKESQRLADGSDYLTSEVWHYVATQDAKYMESYWNEVNVVKSRDEAISQLRKSALTEEEDRLIESAKNESDRLIEKEAWAMRLIADSTGMDIGQMPPEIAAVSYTEGEDQLAPAQKRELATQYIFGEEYAAVKEQITGDISSFRRYLMERKNEELSEKVAENQRALTSMGYLMLALILIFILEIFVFYALVIRPFRYYARVLAQMDGGAFTALTPMGTQGTRQFAGAFNQIYADWQKQKQKLENERQRFHIALDNTSDIVYEYNVTSDTFTAYGSLGSKKNSGETSHKEYRIKHFMEKHLKKMLNETDMDNICQTLCGGDASPIDMQVSPVGMPGKIWVNITRTPVYDEERRMVKIIGKISNIQVQKERELALEDASSRDGLTGFYRREAGVRKVQDYMNSKSPDEICGMMFLDMDDFGTLNESEGQVFADAILQDVADIIRTNTDPDDILVRLGGDEFMLFLKNCPKSKATILGPKIAAAIRELSGQLDKGVTVSASIGMCVTQVVDEYSGLYRCAESTLHYVKQHDKGEAACYLDTSTALGTLLTKMYPDSYYINKIDHLEGAQEDIPSFALNLLGRTKNLDDAVYQLLSRTGRTCGLDRIVIREVDPQYLGCKVIYQWVKNPADSIARGTMYMTRDQIKELTAAYGENGICDYRVVTSPEGMSSILHAAIWDYESCVGTMSFELHAAHTWTGEERKLLGELTKIIASFILKARADADSQAKTDFLSRMSHEIRTPMNAINGMTFIARQKLGDPEKTRECLDKIESANKYLLSLINDILDMSRIESGKMELHTEPVDMRNFTDSLDSLIRLQTQENGLTFVTDNQYTSDRQVMADELRLNQILVNLLGNAVKFTEEGGTVTLRVEQEEKTAQGVQLKFSVIDTGIGITKEAQERIFNAFEQAGTDTAAKYGGTGLGLSISSSLVQMMGGTLEVKSAPGEGASFSFTAWFLYAAKQSQTEEKQVAADRGRIVDLKGKRILLAEDNKLNQEIAQEILDMNGFAVETVEDGRGAVEAFSQHDPGYYAAILMDIRMPVMDGMEATRRIRTMERADSRSVLIIAMTANAFDEDMKQSLENGMDSYITKPLDVEKFISLLKELIAARGE